MVPSGADGCYEGLSSTYSSTIIRYLSDSAREVSGVCR